MKALVSQPDGVPRLVGILLYGTGARVFEVMRLRVKDLDLSRDVLTAAGTDLEVMTVE